MTLISARIRFVLFDVGGSSSCRSCVGHRSFNLHWKPMYSACVLQSPLTWLGSSQCFVFFYSDPIVKHNHSLIHAPEGGTSLRWILYKESFKQIMHWISFTSHSSALTFGVMAFALIAFCVNALQFWTHQTLACFCPKRRHNT